jgi:hypothetical protein
MNKLDYNRGTKEIHSAIPLRIVKLSELANVGENLFQLNGADIPFSKHAKESFDKLIGITKGQQKMVKKASGETGIRNFRNYINVANDITKNSRIILIANELTHSVTNIIPIKKDFIPCEQFLEFVQLFIDGGEYEMDHIEDSDDGIVIFLNALNPIIDNIDGDDKFITNNIYLSWTFTKVELGRFYFRLVCSNGSTVRIEKKQSTVYALGPDEINHLINLSKDKAARNKDFMKFRKAAIQARNTYASLRELNTCQQLLLGCSVEDYIVEDIFHYNDLIKICKEKEINAKVQAPFIRTSSTIWELYNELTDFASHNDSLDKGDYRRGKILDGARDFLNHKYDIITYIDI